MNGGVPSPPSSSSPPPASAFSAPDSHGSKYDDNPFVRQMEVMLARSVAADSRPGRAPHSAGDGSAGAEAIVGGKAAVSSWRATPTTSPTRTPKHTTATSLASRLVGADPQASNDSPTPHSWRDITVTGLSPGGGASARHLRLGTGKAGTLERSWSPNTWKTAEPKVTSSWATGTAVFPRHGSSHEHKQPRQQPQQQPREKRIPLSISDLSSSEEEEEAEYGVNNFRLFHGKRNPVPIGVKARTPTAGGAVGAAPPNLAEAKKAVRAGALDNHENGGTDHRHSDRSQSSGPGSDGGWPERKRCPPPHLNSRSHISPWQSGTTTGGVLESSSMATVVDGDPRCKGRRKGKRRAKCSRSSSTSSPEKGRATTGGRAIHGDGATHHAVGFRSGPLGSDHPARGATTPIGVEGSEEVQGNRRLKSTKSKTKTMATITGSVVGVMSDDSAGDWMMDAEDRGAAVDSTMAESRLGRDAAGDGSYPRRRNALKRGRTPPVKSYDDAADFYCSDGSGSDGSRRRGSKTGRRDLCPAKVARRPRSSSLSLSTPRFSAYDSNYDSAEGDDEEERIADRSKAGSASKSAARRYSSNSSGGTRRRKDQRASARSDGEANGSPGGARDSGSCKGRSADRNRFTSNGRGLKRGREEHLPDRIEAMRVESDEEDDELDDEELKPNMPNPTWLGPLEAYDLGGGGSINPSINRYLKDYQRDGVRPCLP